MPETDFLWALARRTGCGLLLDINNVVVSGANHGFDPSAYLDSFPHEHVGEIHLAGHAVLESDDEALFVDTHDRTVSAEVWSLFRDVIARHGANPTLIEWDSDVPAWRALEDEVRQAQSVLQTARGLDARAA